MCICRMCCSRRVLNRRSEPCTLGCWLVSTIYTRIVIFIFVFRNSIDRLFRVLSQIKYTRLFTLGSRLRCHHIVFRNLVKHSYMCAHGLATFVPRSLARQHCLQCMWLTRGAAPPTPSHTRNSTPVPTSWFVPARPARHISTCMLLVEIFCLTTRPPRVWFDTCFKTRVRAVFCVWQKRL